jgi:hypothetical protein
MTNRFWTRLVLSLSIVTAVTLLAAKPIGTIGNIESITCGGRNITDLSSTSGFKILTGSFDNGSTNTTLRAAFAGAGYIVPALKVYRIVCVKATSTGLAAISLGYSDNDVGLSTVTAFTNPVSVTGGASLAGLDGALIVATNSAIGEYALNASVPTGKYVGGAVVAGGTATAAVVVYGYEE